MGTFIIKELRSESEKNMSQTDILILLFRFKVQSAPIQNIWGQNSLFSFKVQPRLSHLHYFLLHIYCNCTRTQNHLVGKRTLNHLTKLGVCLRTKWFWV